MGLADSAGNADCFWFTVSAVGHRTLALAILGCNRYPTDNDWLLLATKKTQINHGMRLKKDAIITRLFCFSIFYCIFLS